MTDATIDNLKDGSRCIQAAGDTVLRAGLRAGLGYSYECNSGGCGSCKFELVSGEIETLWPEAPGLSARDRAKGKHLACQCRARGPVSIRIGTADEYAPRIAPHRQRAQLREIHPITHDIREFRFIAEHRADFLPGQYAMLDLPGLASPRAYSMSNLPNAERAWHFQIRRVPGGSGTAILFDRLAIGDEIGLDGPYGLAFLRADSPRDILCIAGGSGLAPMISIARAAAAAGMLRTRKLSFFYGGRTPADICGEPMLRELSESPAAVSYHPVVSDADLSTGWEGLRGYVHEEVNKYINKNPFDWEYYFAGPPKMTQSLQELLMIDLCVPYNQIHFDRFY